MKWKSRPSRSARVAAPSPDATTIQSAGSANRWRNARRSPGVSPPSNERTITRNGTPALARPSLRYTAVIGQVPVQRVKIGRSNAGAPAATARRSRAAPASSITANAASPVRRSAGTSAASRQSALTSDDAIVAIERLQERRQVRDQDRHDAG